MSSNPHAGTVVIYAPHGRDGPVLDATLRADDLTTAVCGSEGDLLRELQRVWRGEPGTLLLTQDALSAGVREALATVREREPVWASLPVVLLVDEQAPADVPGNDVTYLRRPASPRELVSVVSLALDTRARQLTNRDLLAQLGEANSRLEARVAERTAQLRRYAEQLEREIDARKEAEARLRQARSRLAQRREEARRRIGRDLHDDVLQRVLHLNIQVEEALRSGARPTIANLLASLRDDVRRLAHGIRHFIRDLRPVGLDLDLSTALDALVETTKEQYASVPEIRVRTDLDGRLPSDVRLGIYRAAQELIRNSVEHANAQRIEVHLEATHERVTLMVRDDGIGFAPPDRLEEFGLENHFGLLGVQEHIEALAGRLAIESTPEHGTTVHVQAPLTRRT